jgi:molecular chaperone HtpG
MKINLPQKFNEILIGEYRALVDNAISKYKDIYINNKLEFFQDYTDHGFEHIEEVLETAANIIDDNSFEYLNEKDISVLILSILLHDVGMHISKEGLSKILDSDFDKWRVKYFDNKSWIDEWINYFQEAKRFNDEQLLNIFGNTNQNITEPNLETLDDYDRKIYGEYLRRFHHRLAHEIALSGFPTQIGNENVTINSDGIEFDIIDLAGLVARSHGMPIRKAIDYLEFKYQDAWRAPYNVKAVFLMVVIRIADYLQIHSGRASKIILKSKRFESPLSRQEWEKHGAIKDINIKTADPERIFVIAKPENSIIYLELIKLFKDIQSELDISWAVLGEAYGKDDELKNLKIKYRRIRSVLDDKIGFDKTINYIPEQVFFNADPALLKLLIGPLYGDDPKYGIRELLQNSIDAIKEREFLNHTPGKVSITLQAIKKDKPRYEIIISDSGIGMSKDTIINYFFKAGASFRKNMEWKKNFIDDNEVKIQKTGRFGVGVLAIFLLGDEFELWTKYDNDESQGYYCKASLGMSQVELLKQDCTVGTTIKISLKENVNAIINHKLFELEEFSKKKRSYYDDSIELLEWFSWYVMDKPKIEYKLQDKIGDIFWFIQPDLLISSNPEITLNNWRSFTTKDYRSIHWILDLLESNYYTYTGKQKYYHHNKLSCNGFKINKAYVLKNKSYIWTEPKISVFDNNAHFPLSLNRDYIQDDSLPFEEELLENISIEIITAILKTEFSQIGPYYVAKPNILRFIGEVDLSEFIVVLGDEFTILNSSIFSILKLASFDQIWFKKHSALASNYNFIPKSAYQATIATADPISFYKPILEAHSYDGNRLKNWFNLASQSNKYGTERKDNFSRTYISSSKLEYLLEGKRLSKSFKDGIIHNPVNKKWVEIVSEKSNKFNSNVNIEDLNTDLYPLIKEISIHSTFEKDDIFIKTWEKYLNKEWTFPIELSKRPDFLKKRS